MLDDQSAHGMPDEMGRLLEFVDYLVQVFHIGFDGFHPKAAFFLAVAVVLQTDSVGVVTGRGEPWQKIIHPAPGTHTGAMDQYDISFFG